MSDGRKVDDGDDDDDDDDDDYEKEEEVVDSSMLTSLQFQAINGNSKVILMVAHSSTT